MSEAEVLPIVAKVAGLTSAGIFTGYTISLSRATVPTILAHTTVAPDSRGYEAIVLSQWRHQFVDGAFVSRPLCAVSALSFIYLAYHTDASTTHHQACSGSTVRALYALACLSATGVLYALTLLRRTNGALGIRAKRVVGPYFMGGSVDGKAVLKGQAEARPWAITYASHERRSIERESGRESERWKDTRELVGRWRWHNDVRSVLLVAGMVCGALGVVLDRS